MKYVKILMFLLTATLFSVACQQNTSEEVSVEYACPMDCENGKVYDEPGRCPVCKMSLEEVAQETDEQLENMDTEMSIFNMDSEWLNQNGETFNLKSLKGEPFVLSMIYTRCEAACPRLVADMQQIEKQQEEENLRFVLVSMDPDNDTPDTLKIYADYNRLESPRWVLLTGDKENSRMFSNLIAMKYRKVSEKDFSHSNMINLFNQKGELVFQQEGLGVDNSALIAAIDELKKSE